ncbi:MAG: HYR domain-containing protein, partial [Flavobacteriales bacterium]
MDSGSTFHVGETSVTYRTNDADGLSTSCSFVVSVVDAEPPTITCPANIVT